jgi:glycosyltransferase involved in cell wall biosynthesis
MKNIWAFTLGRKGGIVHYANNMLSEMRLQPENNLTIFASKYCEQGVPKESILISTYKNKVQFFVNSLFVLPLLIIQLLITAKKNEIDFIYFPYWHFWNAPIIFIAKKMKIPILSTVHDGVLHTGDGEPFEQQLNRYCIKESGGLVFLTKYVKNLVENQIGFVAKSFVIPIGLIIPNGILSNVRQISSKPKLLFFGRVNYYKGIDILIEAINQLDPNLFDYCSIVGKWADDSIKSTIKTEKIKVYDGWIEEDDISNFYNNSDILILPYREASQSGVISIGIAGSIPMVCARVGGLVDQLEEGKHSLFFKGEDVEDLKLTLEDLLKNSDKFENISSNLNKLQKTLEWKDISLSVCNALNEIKQ